MSSRHRLHKTFVTGNKITARDSSFRLLYLLLRADLEDETKTRQKMYHAVLFIVSHRGIFKYNARMTIRMAYEERFHVSEKQGKFGCPTAGNGWSVVGP